MPAGPARRALWFAALYGASLVAFIAAVYALRALMPR